MSALKASGPHGYARLRGDNVPVLTPWRAGAGLPGNCRGHVLTLAGQTMLPTSFLRQLISFYGDQMQMVVPSFLEQSMIAFAKEQERFREQMNAAVGKSPIEMMKMAAPMKAIEEQTRRNIELFQNAMRMFTPFNYGGPAQAEPARAEEPPASPSGEKEAALDDMKAQLAAMQAQLNKLASKE